LHLAQTKLFSFTNITVSCFTSRALHSELLTELSSRFLSREKFSRVETRSVEHHFFVTFGNFGKRLVPTVIFAKKRIFSQFFRNFLQKLGSEQVGASSSQFSRVRKAQTLPKYFRKSKKVNFRNSQKRKIRKKLSNAGPYLQVHIKRGNAQLSGCKLDTLHQKDQHKYTFTNTAHKILTQNFYR